MFWRHPNDCFLSQGWLCLTESKARCRTACMWGRGQESQYALLWFPAYCVLLPAWCSSYLRCTRARHFITGILKILLCLPPLENTPKLHQKPDSKQNLLSEQWNMHQKKIWASSFGEVIKQQRKMGSCPTKPYKFICKSALHETLWMMESAS